MHGRAVHEQRPPPHARQSPRGATGKACMSRRSPRRARPAARTSNVTRTLRGAAGRTCATEWCVGGPAQQQGRHLKSIPCAARQGGPARPGGVLRGPARLQGHRRRAARAAAAGRQPGAGRAHCGRHALPRARLRHGRRGGGPVRARVGRCTLRDPSRAPRYMRAGVRRQGGGCAPNAAAHRRAVLHRL